MIKDICYCGLKKRFENCCEPLIKGIQKAETAEALMRSRYSAYVVHEVEYLIKTTYPAQRKYHSKEEMLGWAIDNQWQKLEIIYVTQNTVEFKAYYLDSINRNHIHHEFSNFKFEDENWFYINGIIY